MLVTAELFFPVSLMSLSISTDSKKILRSKRLDHKLMIFFLDKFTKSKIIIKMLLHLEKEDCKIIYIEIGDFGTTNINFLIKNSIKISTLSHFYKTRIEKL